ncbi:hypothetical protein PCAR4_250032 [Paraburkholderia caribensis]|nr:hypothetical protein PCAR4_250032 [Paraburkholderia caribensis]
MTFLKLDFLLRLLTPSGIWSIRLEIASEFSPQLSREARWAANEANQAIDSGLTIPPGLNS